VFDLHVAEIVNKNGLSETLGYRLIIRSGCTALDFLVSTNERGRELDANSALYWHAIVQAKENGCRWFDIGGLNENTTKGIAEFKQGLNAVPYKLVGEWRKWWYS
jgi:lipid II:glycine glycyltransferase (peptidoglycan interpeptide bridge formation enzyme)